VIRRGFWIVVGATGGIMGYRRAVSVGRQLSQSLGTRPKPPGSVNAVKRHWAREAIRFSRDVREGIDLYLSRHPGSERPNLGASTANQALPVTTHVKRKTTDAVG
jgi:hypothetical protein